MLPQCSIPVSTFVGDRELQKKDLVFGVFALPLHSVFLRFSKERELGPNDTQRGKGRGQKTLNEYYIVVNQYFGMTIPGVGGNG